MSVRRSEIEVFDLSRVRTRRSSDPHYVNVDLDNEEIGYLELSNYGDVVRTVVGEGKDIRYGRLIDQIRRLAEPIASAAATCASQTTR